eukprot:gene5517-20502_t
MGDSEFENVATAEFDDQRGGYDSDGTPAKLPFEDAIGGGRCHRRAAARAP